MKQKQTNIIKKKKHALYLNFKLSELHCGLKVVGRDTCSNHIKFR